MPEAKIPEDGLRVQVSLGQTHPAYFDSAPELASAFGQAIIEPAWWPTDIGQVSYGLEGPAGRTHYRIGSLRAEGAPIHVVGMLEAAWAGRSPRDWLNGDWSEPSELAHVRGLVGWVGAPAGLHVVVYHGPLAIQLIGYRDEEEALTAARSLRPVEPA